VVTLPWNTQLKEIKYYLTNLIAEKLDIIEKYFAHAKVNIDEYDKKTLIGTDKMINSWRPIDERIKQAIDGSINQNNGILQIFGKSNNFADLTTVKDWSIKERDHLNYIGKQKLDIFQNSLISKLIDLKERVKERLFSDIDNGLAINTENIQEDISVQLEEVNFINDIKYNILTLYNENYKNTFDFLSLISYPELKRQIESLKNRTKTVNPIETVSKQIADAKIVLTEIFETYKDGVKIYTVAAFSVEAKSYIKKLGLSDRLDLIDLEEPDIASYLNQTENEIFKSYYSSIKTFDAKCSDIFSTLNNIELVHPILTPQNNVDEISNEESKIIELSNIKIEETQQNFRGRIKNHFLTKIQSIYSALLTLVVDRDNELKELKKKRTRYYITKYLPTLIVIVITVILFYVLPKLSVSNSLSIGNQWVLGILVNATSAIINTIVSIKRDKHKIYKSEINRRFLENEKELIAKILSQEYDYFRNNACSNFCMEIDLIQQSLANEILGLIQSGKFNINNKTIHTLLISNENILKKSLLSYSAALSEFKSACHNILNNNSTNKEILFRQSKLIKESSISPSFKLLSETRNNIFEVKNVIENIDFV